MEDSGSQVSHIIEDRLRIHAGHPRVGQVATLAQENSELVKNTARLQDGVELLATVEMLVALKASPIGRMAVHELLFYLVTGLGPLLRHVPCGFPAHLKTPRYPLVPDMLAFIELVYDGEAHAVMEVVELGLALKANCFNLKHLKSKSVRI